MPNLPLALLVTDNNIPAVPGQFEVVSYAENCADGSANGLSEASNYHSQVEDCSKRKCRDEDSDESQNSLKTSGPGSATKKQRKSPIPLSGSSNVAASSKPSATPIQSELSSTSTPLSFVPSFYQPSNVFHGSPKTRHLKYMHHLAELERTTKHSDLVTDEDKCTLEARRSNNGSSEDLKPTTQTIEQGIEKLSRRVDGLWRDWRVTKTNIEEMEKRVYEMQEFYRLVGLISL